MALGLDTPPQTDIDYSSQASAIDSETDTSSFHDIDSDIEAHSGTRRGHLSVLSETQSDVDERDNISDDGYELVDMTFTQEHGGVMVEEDTPTMNTLAQGITSLTIQEAPPDDSRSVNPHRLRERPHIRTLRPFRSTSSPSRSPARLYPSSFNRISSKRKKHTKIRAQSLYEYLFA